MRCMFEPMGTPEALDRALNACMQAHEPRGLLVLAATGNEFVPESIDPILERQTVPIFGGTFAGIMHGGTLHERGTVLVAIPTRPRIQIVHELSREDQDLEAVLAEDLVGDDGRTMFVIVDGYASRVNSLLYALFHVYGLGVNYLGGGAGTLDYQPVPSLLTNHGMVRDAAVLAVIDQSCGIGVSHGMESISGPHKITSVRPNEICTLDWEPAAARYDELINQFGPDELLKGKMYVSKEFCVAVNRMGDEKVVMELIRAEPDGALRTALEVTEGEFVDIVRATPQSTIRSATSALRKAQDTYPGRGSATLSVCFDCSGRWNYLGDRFGEEMAALAEASHDVVGVLTIGGEIANCGRDFLDYYNRTCVVGMFGD